MSTVLYNRAKRLGIFDLIMKFSFGWHNNIGFLKFYGTILLLSEFLSFSSAWILSTPLLKYQTIEQKTNNDFHSFKGNTIKSRFSAFQLEKKVNNECLLVRNFQNHFTSESSLEKYSPHFDSKSIYYSSIDRYQIKICKYFSQPLSLFRADHWSLRTLYDTVTDMEIPLPLPKDKVAIIIVDHGSRKKEANEQLYNLIEKYKAMTGYATVEGAHLEVLEPSIGTTFEKCVKEGATHIIAHPFFLTNGRHVLEDIPREMKEAGEKFPNIRWSISKPLGAQQLIPKLVQRSIVECMLENDVNPYKVQRSTNIQKLPVEEKVEILKY